MPIGRLIRFRCGLSADMGDSPAQQSLENRREACSPPRGAVTALTACLWLSPSGGRKDPVETPRYGELHGAILSLKGNNRRTPRSPTAKQVADGPGDLDEEAKRPGETRAPPAALGDLLHSVGYAWSAIPASALTVDRVPSASSHAQRVWRRQRASTLRAMEKNRAKVPPVPSLSFR